MAPLESIKFIRKLLDLPLKEAKDIYDQHVHGQFLQGVEITEALIKRLLYVAEPASVNDYRLLRQAYHNRKWR